MNQLPKVSIIIPSYNHKKYILETLKSIQAQTYKNIETLVIDDGSTDGSAEFLMSVQNQYNFQLIVKENEGLCKTLNRGLEQITGDFIVIIASDDYMPTNRIAEQVLVFETHHHFDAVAGGMTLIDEASNILKYVSPPKTGSVKFFDMLDQNIIFAPTVMLKSSTFKKYGHYNPEHVIEDYSMWLKILSKGGTLANFDKNWAFYRVHQVVTRSKVDWYYKGLVQVFSEYLDNPVVSRAFAKRKLKYFIKVSIFDGVKGLKEIIKNETKGLGWVNLIILYTVAWMPIFVRNVLKKRLNKI